MDLKPIISMESVTIKEQHWLLSNRKHKMKECKEYLEDTLILIGHQMRDTNKAIAIHFYFFWEIIWALIKLYANKKKVKLIIKNNFYVV